MDVANSKYFKMNNRPTVFEKIEKTIAAFNHENISKERKEILSQLIDFIQSMPTLQHEIDFDCGQCGAKNKHKLEGLSDFF